MNRSVYGAFIVLALFLCQSVRADQPAPADTQFIADLMASEKWSDLLLAKKDQVTSTVCDQLISEGKRLRTKGEFSGSMKAYQVAEAVANQIGNKNCLAQAIRGIGIAYSIQGNMAASLENYEKSLSIARDIEDKPLIAACLRSIGVYYVEVGNDEQALDYLRQSLAITEELGDVKSSLPTMLNLGVVSVENGNFAEGLRYYTRMLATKELEGSPDLFASTLNNTAIVYDYQGDTAQALEYYQRSMKIREQMGDKANIANLLNNMGDARIVGSEDRALENHKKALAIAEEIGDKSLEGRALADMGGAYRRKGDFKQALEYSERALHLAEEINDPEILAGQLRNIAQVHLAKGEYQEALDDSMKAAEWGRKIHSRQDESNALEIQGKVYRALHQPDKAAQAFQASIAIIEDWNSLVAGGEIERLDHFAEKASVYYEMIDLLVEQKQDAEALHYAERMKARALLNVLHSGKVEISHAMTPQELEQEKTLQARIVDLNERLQQGKENPDLKEQLQRARLDLEAFRTKLYVNHPELKVTRGESPPVSMNDLANHIDVDTAILEYVVTDTKTFLFVLSQQAGTAALKVFTIPIKQSDLSAKVRDLRTQIAERDLRVQSAARQMYQLVLLPAEKEIASRGKWMLIPDDTLWELPFQVLESSRNRFVLQDHAICYSPSMTVYYEMRRLHKQEGAGTPTLLAFGNPEIGPRSKELLDVVYRDEKLAPLPEAEKEVTALKTLYGEKNSKIFTGKAAREDFLKQQAAQYEILHFATHGILNDTTPLYSQILLTPGADASKEDGLLEAWEIMNLDLRARLVVLSACETALGKVRRGEGMIGLTWAFFIAGAPATVVSQWKVNSASTTQLMLAFHKELKANPAGSKAEALRKAALSVMQNDSYRHPFYWAPFILVGNGFE